jgi:hypothetical protein
MATFQEKQLGQLRPANTTAASIYAPGSTVTAIIKNIMVCNTSGAGAKYRIFHDADGTTYDETSALFWDDSIAADETVTITSFTAMNKAGNLAVRTDTANALTFTAYGAELTE